MRWLGGLSDQVRYSRNGRVIVELLQRAEVIRQRIDSGMAD